MANTCTITWNEDGGVSIAGALTFESVPSLYVDAMNTFQKESTALLIDLSDLTAVDSSGLALLLEWQAIRQKASREMEVRNAPAGLMSLANLCEADDVMKISGRDQPS